MPDAPAILGAHYLSRPQSWAHQTMKIGLWNPDSNSDLRHLVWALLDDLKLG